MEEKDGNKKFSFNNLSKNAKIGIAIAAAVVAIILVFILGRVTSNNQNIENDAYDSEATDRYWNPEDTSNTSQGGIYKKTNLVDSNSGITAFTGLLPQGWTATIQSNYNVISPDYPVLFSVTITSPDGKASIVIDSPEQFCESPTMGEGASLEYYTTYLHYMTADEFVEYFMNQSYPNSTLIKSLETDNELLNEARSFQQQRANTSRQTLSTIIGGSYSASTMSGSVTEGEVTASKRQYQTQNGYLEGSCVVIPFTITTSSNYYSLTNTYWELPYSIVYFASDKDSFDKYYDDYNFIIANSQFTTDAYALIEYVSSCIANVKTAEANAKSQASLNAMNNYIDSNYSSTSSQSTNDKVMEMWDDVIKEVDCYTTEDGSKVKTSIYNDTVAQNGDSFYVGSKAGIPSGYTELSKGY